MKTDFYKGVYEKNIDLEKSFAGAKQSIEIVQHEPKAALLYTKNAITKDSDLKCKVILEYRFFEFDKNILV